ncbi:hypothetical protein PVAND_014224 [Polypedilum vanderplanki]|uniref:EF-hand domain-containing protein n=1 Tax=Polypedilum vanderplanki TaxID=319348 RepID=A0A9J6CSH5_POLVA|nr:hypothetical protein PVAND_014224 [Polypedilum vanderplanki]
MSEEISSHHPVPHIEVVNEIQIVVSNKKDNLPRSSCVSVTTPNDNKDIRKCISSRSSKTDITVTTPTTATLDTTTKQVTTKNERRTSKGEKEKSDSGSICVCGKLLKRVKELLEAKETKTKKNEEDEIILPVRYYPESLSALSSATSFSEQEIKKMYRSFKASCPTGFIKEDTFKDIYSQFFPFGVSTAQYAHYVFNSIDRDSNGSVSFEEFVLNLSTLSRGSLDEKLKWTFQLYDVNGDGFISREEMTEVMTSVYELMGKVPEGCKEENQIKEKVDNVFKKMDMNADDKISLDEFLISCHKDDGILRSIAVFQTIF